MQIKIARIEGSIVTCEILDGDGGRIDIARRWFTEDVAVGDQIVIDMERGQGMHICYSVP